MSRMRTKSLQKLLRRSAQVAVLYLFTGIFFAYTGSAQILSISSPTSQTVSKGSSVSYSVSVLVLLGAPSYQWYFNNVKISGATGTSLTVTNVSVSNIGSYYVAVNDGLLGSGNSSTATLTVTDLPPTVINDAYTCLQNTSLTVAAPGVLANDAAAFAGPLTATLVTNVSHGTLVLNSNGGFTYLAATNYYGSDSFSYIASDGMSNSVPATVNLTILAPPSITSQPQNLTVAANQNATFSVTASGTAPLSYQWYLQGSLLNSATNSTLTVSNVANKNAGRYSVMISNVVSSITSTSAVLTVISLPEVSTLAASNITTNSAVLNAAVNPKGGATSYYFEYGLTTNYDGFSKTNTQSAGTDGNVSAAITNLVPGAIYHYCIVAGNAAGTSVGADMTFTAAYLPPKVVILDVTNTTASSVTLRAWINPEGASTGYYFQYGPNAQASQAASIGSIIQTNYLPAKTNGMLVSMSITGLTPGAVYNYSVVALSSGGSTVTTNKTFSTLSIPPIQFSGTMVNQGTPAQGMQLTLSSVSGVTFTVLGTTDLTLPLASWTVLGTMTETTPGQYQFNDSQSMSYPCWYYKIKSQ